TAIGRTLRTHFVAVEEIARQNDERAREGAVAEAVAFRTRIEASRLAHELALAETQALRACNMLAALLGLLPDELPPLPDDLSATSAMSAGLLPAPTPSAAPDDGMLPDDA